MIRGYARVSTADQSLNRQIDALKKAGCTIIYQEKKTGTKMARRELERLLSDLQEGDTVIVTELTRLSRSTKDLFSLTHKIEQAGANIKSLKESWLDTTTPHGKLLFTLFAGISQFERDLIAERTREGLEAARDRGRVGGRPRVPERRIKTAIDMYNNGFTVKEISEATSVSSATLYRRIEQTKSESR